MRSVFGYFQTVEQAQKAATALKDQGYQKVSIDRFAPTFGRKPDDLNEEITSLFQDPGYSLATTTLGSPATLDDDERILAATQVDASGQSGGTGFIHTEDICITVLTDDANYQKAEGILQSYGAE